uniref:Ig-like domain-containing protein n=1 Tax=Chrysemys picta bellii TaxID=8478 RepID=A0A8C3H6B2_CHRPI
MELHQGRIWPLFLWFPEVQEYDSRAEGQRLVVECRYRSADYSATRKTWCQPRDKKCSPLVITSYTSYGYHSKVTSGRTTIEDDTRKGIVTIIMEKLQVQDSGLYWCALYDPPNTLYPLTTIQLDVFKGESDNETTSVLKCEPRSGKVWEPLQYSVKCSTERQNSLFTILGHLL